MSETPVNPSLAETYWTESRRPLASLAFIMPMMLIYEIGVWTLGVQNGADAWMRYLLNLMGFGQHFYLPLLTVAMLLGWQHLTHQPWRFSPRVLSSMAVESLLLAICLRMVLFFQSTLMLSVGGQFRNAVGYLGAGIYEELLFRLILLSAATWLIRRVWSDQRKSLVLAVLATSLVFSAAHYEFFNPAGEPFTGFSFLFRFMAGIFFAVLFLYRGFGITAGAHALYDILVGIF